MNERPKLGVIIVNYKTVQETVRFIKTELIKIKVDKAVLIVNNTFTTEDLLCYQQELDPIFIDESDGRIPDSDKPYIINSTENLGFARGNNLGAFTLLKNCKPDFLLFTNNDLEIVSSDVIEQLTARLEGLRDVAAIGPRIVNRDNEHVSPRFDKISPYRFIAQHLFYPIRALRILNWFKISSPGTDEIRQRTIPEGYCYWVSGTFFLVRADDFLAADGFDPKTFLYCEEKNLAERFLLSGKREYYYARPVIQTVGGLSTKRYLTDRAREQILFDSEMYYYRTYFSLSPIQKGLLRVARFMFLNIYFPLTKH
jgi:GT2 family glycosyltransferase